MVSGELLPLGRRGLSAAELLVVVGMIGILAATAMPSVLAYWQAQTLRAGAEELAAIIHQARQAAINGNCGVTLTQAGNRARIDLGSTCPPPPYCSSLPCPWRGPGTDASGTVRLAHGLDVTAGSVAFNYLGAASTPGTFTVTDPRTGRRQNVVVALSGRVTIP
jgi:type II secretory pathway pseudopilin PulG